MTSIQGGSCVTQSTSLVQISKARQALQAASSLHDVLSIRDKAEAIRCYLSAASESRQCQNQAAELKLRAERKAGEMLAKMPEISKGRKKCPSMGHLILMPLG